MPDERGSGVETHMLDILRSNISQAPETEPTQDMQNVMLSRRWPLLTTEAELTLWHRDEGKDKANSALH